MLNHTNQTFVGSVLFLDIVEYSKKPVMEQLKIKQRFNALLAQALGHIAPRDRIILDTGDGAAVSFLGTPEEALFVAAAFRDSNSGADGNDHIVVRCGINLGPLRLIKDINGQLNIIGDGINVAQRIMSFAGAGQILASRSYYEVVSCLSEDYPALFSYEGSRTDKHVREHEVYTVGVPRPSLRPASAARHAPAQRGGRRVFVAAPLLFAIIVGGGMALRVTLHANAGDTPPPATEQVLASANVQGTAAEAKPAALPGGQPTVAAGGQPTATASGQTTVTASGSTAATASRHAVLSTTSEAGSPATTAQAKSQTAKQVTLPAIKQAAPKHENTAATVTAALSSKGAGDFSAKSAAIPPIPAPAATVASVASNAKPSAEAKALADAKTPSDSRAANDLKAAERKPASPQWGYVVVNVIPWGEIFVDGKPRGMSPPLKNVQLEPGSHVVEFRNANFPSFTFKVAAHAGEETPVYYRFE